MDGFLSNFGNIGDFFTVALMRIIPALLCITIHELSHGYTAYKLGDSTAKQMGRLTLNPIKHIDPIGLLMMLLMGFGWAKPVPVNAGNFKNMRLGMAVTAFAGPLSNLLLATLILIIFFLLPFPYGGFPALISGAIVPTIIFSTALLSVALAIFNLLPIPPLDGSKVLFSLLPMDYYTKVLRYERYGMILLVVLVVSGRFFDVGIFDVLVIRPAWAVLAGISSAIEAVIGFFG